MSSLAELTSKEAVLQAIVECDAIGRQEFLKRYGFRFSRDYILQWNGNRYDSKAIAGVAYGKQHGTPLRSRDFSGGLATVVPALQRLGFNVNKTPHPAIYLVPGQTYIRKELLELFGGQLQRGIWTPREFPVLFLFTGESGEEYGYRDGPTPDGMFKYTGEGQLGDMQFTGGNKAIRDHRELGKDLMLFEESGDGIAVRYLGIFECASSEEADGVDKLKQPRKIIIFNLVPVRSAALDAETAALTALGGTTTIELTLAELRVAAYEAAKRGSHKVPRKEAKAIWRERSTKVRTYVLQRASGLCESCGSAAPFKRRDGSPYLEPHHTTRLADDGPDHPAHVGAICPTCHRRIHSGEDGVTVNERLMTKLAALESRVGNPAEASE